MIVELSASPGKYSLVWPRDALKGIGCTLYSKRSSDGFGVRVTVQVGVVVMVLMVVSVRVTVVDGVMVIVPVSVTVGGMVVVFVTVEVGVFGAALYNATSSI